MCFVRVYIVYIRYCACGIIKNRCKGTASFLYACALSYQMMVQSYFSYIYHYFLDANNHENRLKSAGLGLPALHG